MFDSNKNYWLYIASHTYCCNKGTQLLLYNTKTGVCMESHTKEIVTLIAELHKKKNLGAIAIKGKVLAEAPYQSFITEFCEKDMGGLVDGMQEKPIQLMPVLNLQRDIEKLQQDKERFTGEELLHYLVELNIYINNSCSLNCPFCNSYFRQGLCCTKQQPPANLSIETIQYLLSQVKNAPIGKLNILGGNIALYPHWETLNELLLDFKERVHLWIHYANFATNPIDLDYKYDLPVTFPINDKAFAETTKRLQSEQACYHFFITNEEEYNQVEYLLQKYTIKNYFIYPVYTITNRSFFEHNIYIGRDDIFSNTLSFREIFARQKLNTNFFGALTVMPNGDVFANVNEKSIGNGTTISILNLIEKEMTVNTAWRKTRDTKPCTDCVYQYLCPSPSNYEKVIGQSNLCHIIF